VQNVHGPLDPASIHAIAAELAALLERRGEPRQLLTAGQVAERFNVERSWVYAHAHELGVVRLTDSTRSRLRFDPAVVAQRLLTGALSEPRQANRFVRRHSDVPLLPVRGRTSGGDTDGPRD
jgi:hypothetical protein